MIKPQTILAFLDKLDLPEEKMYSKGQLRLFELNITSSDEQRYVSDIRNTIYEHLENTIDILENEDECISYFCDPAGEELEVDYTNIKKYCEELVDELFNKYSDISDDWYEYAHILEDWISKKVDIFVEDY